MSTDGDRNVNHYCFVSVFITKNTYVLFRYTLHYYPQLDSAKP